MGAPKLQRNQGSQRPCETQCGEGPDAGVTENPHVLTRVLMSRSHHTRSWMPGIGCLSLQMDGV